jgi:xylan 1,4-beta-xylosidase
MFGLLGNERLKLSSRGALKMEDILVAGVPDQPDINAIAARSEHSVEVLIWNYHDDDLSVPDSPVELTITGLPAKAGLLEHFRIDATHSNSLSAWKEMGSPQQPSLQQRQQLEDAAQLHLLNSPAWIPFDNGIAHLQFSLPREAVSLVRIVW